MDSEEETNTVKLRDHLERRMCEMERRFEIKLDAMNAALDVTAKEVDRRLVELNELRKEVTQDRGQFIQREGYSIWRDTIESRLTRIETRGATRAETLVLLLTIAGLVIAAVKLMK